MATTAESLIALLRRRGPLAARRLQSELGVSQPTLSRLVTAAGDRVVRIGRARRTAYAAVREVDALGKAWPLHRVGSRGELRSAGVLHALHPDAWWVDAPSPPAWFDGEQRDGVFPDLPWFLDDLRPQGFLGRAFARAHAVELGLGPDPRLWQTDGVVAALARFGDDLPGDFVLGDAAASRVLESQRREPPAIPVAKRLDQYEERASAAVRGELIGSSAGGEQPKFTSCVRDADGSLHHVIVKFSPPLDTALGERWADLLCAEHLAGETLRRSGVAEESALAPHASETRWLRGPHRAFLEVRRFDRIGAHGRRGVVSLLALESNRGRALDSWDDAADGLERDGWLSPQDSDALRLLWEFGRLIGNTDMHFANVALWLDHGRPLSLAPAYDMLPMLYRPTSGGEIVPRHLGSTLPLPRRRIKWLRAAELAHEFWVRVADDARVSAAFRTEAARNAAAVGEAREMVARPV